jgi:heptosyltransferase-2
MTEAHREARPTSRAADLKLKFVTGDVLVKEVNWLGDLVMSLPALRAIRGEFASGRLAVLVRAELAGLFEGINWVDEVIAYPSAAGLARTMRVIGEIRRRHFDLSILFPNSFESALWVTLGGVRQRVGYATDHRRLMLTDHTMPASDALENHQSQYWLGLIRDTLGITAGSEVIDHKLEVGVKPLLEMRGWLATHRSRPDAPALVAIAPAAAYGPAKEWPLVRYAALIDLIADRFDAECVLIGAPEDRAKCDQVAATARAGAINTAGEISLGEVIALLSLCNGFVGNDSGAMHVAAAVGIPTIGIFGSTNPIRTGPLGAQTRFLQYPVPCSPCLERTCRFGHYDCLRAISPEVVLDALVQFGVFASH